MLNDCGEWRLPERNAKLSEADPRLCSMDMADQTRGFSSYRVMLSSLLCLARRTRPANKEASLSWTESAVGLVALERLSDRTLSCIVRVGSCLSMLLRCDRHAFGQGLGQTNHLQPPTLPSSHLALLSLLLSSTAVPSLILLTHSPTSLSPAIPCP